MATDYDLLVEVTPPAQIVITPELGFDLDVLPAPEITLNAYVENSVNLEVASQPVRLISGGGDYLAGEGIAIVGNEIRLSFDNVPIAT